jgi:hypothetical protein
MGRGKKRAGFFVLAVKKTPGMMRVGFLFGLPECFRFEHRGSRVGSGILQQVLAGRKAPARHLEDHAGIP